MVRFCSVFDKWLTLGGQAKVVGFNREAVFEYFYVFQTVFRGFSAVPVKCHLRRRGT
jgi:hypothetical protein